MVFLPCRDSVRDRQRCSGGGDSLGAPRFVPSDLVPVFLQYVNSPPTPYAFPTFFGQRALSSQNISAKFPEFHQTSTDMASFARNPQLRVFSKFDHLSIGLLLIPNYLSLRVSTFHKVSIFRVPYHQHQYISAFVLLSFARRALAILCASIFLHNACDLSLGVVSPKIDTVSSANLCAVLCLAAVRDITQGRQQNSAAIRESPRETSPFAHVSLATAIGIDKRCEISRV